jgi:hypothetical protein
MDLTSTAMCGIFRLDLEVVRCNPMLTNDRLASLYLAGGLLVFSQIKGA